MPQSTAPAPSGVVHQVYAAFGAGDVPRLLSWCADDVVFEVAAPREHPYGGAFHGHHGVSRFLAAIAGTVDILEFAPGQTLSGDGHVVVVGTERGRVKRTGREYATPWVHLWEVKDGKVTRFREWLDTATFLAAARE